MVKSKMITQYIYENEEKFTRSLLKADFRSNSSNLEASLFSEIKFEFTPRFRSFHVKNGFVERNFRFGRFLVLSAQLD